MAKYVRFILFCFIFFSQKLFLQHNVRDLPSRQFHDYVPLGVQCQLNHLGIVDTAHKSNSNAQCFCSVSVDLKLERSQPEGGLCPGAQVPTSLNCHCSGSEGDEEKCE